MSKCICVFVCVCVCVRYTIWNGKNYWQPSLDTERIHYKIIKEEKKKRTEKHEKESRYECICFALKKVGKQVKERREREGKKKTDCWGMNKERLQHN